MIESKRILLKGALALTVGGLLPIRLAAQPSDPFDNAFGAEQRKLDDTVNPLASVAFLQSGKSNVEDRLFNEETKAITPRGFASNTPISDRATRLIIFFEVSDERLYTRKYQQPTWPHGESGVTIGIGYDLGYVDRTLLKSDWEMLNAAQIADLSKACGKKGSAAQMLIPGLRHIEIPWTIADAQFRQKLLKQYIGQTERALPNTGLLSQDSLGALVSLVYNRGADFASTRPTRREMVAIRRHMTNREFDRIPAEITAMKRIWAGKRNVEGLLARRDLEAALFKRGLNA